MKKVIVILIVAVLIWLGWSAYQSGQGDLPKPDQVVKIGVMAPLTGDVAVYGQSVKSAIEFAAAQANNANIELIFEDSKCDGKDAANAINKLINIDGVSAIIGELCSGATLAAAPIAEESQVVLISPASTSPDITNSGQYIFRTIPSDALQGSFGAQLVRSQDLSRLAIIYTNEDYGQGFEAVLREEFISEGGEIVASEAVEKGATDARTQLTKIKAAEPDSVYVISNSTASTVAILKQMKEVGIVNIKIFGSEGLRSPDVLEGAGVSADALIVSSVSAGSSDFIDGYKAQYGEEPGPFAAQAYDAYMILSQAVNNGAVTGPEIKDAISGISYSGASGDIAFDENGDVTGGYDVVIVNEGKFKPVYQ